MTNEELRAAATEMMIAIAASTRDDPGIRRKEECLYEVCRQWLAEHPEDDGEMTIGPNGNGMWCVYADASCQELIAIFSLKSDAERFVKEGSK